MAWYLGQRLEGDKLIYVGAMIRAFTDASALAQVEHHGIKIVRKLYTKKEAEAALARGNS